MSQEQWKQSHAGGLEVDPSQYDRDYARMHTSSPPFQEPYSTVPVTAVAPVDAMKSDIVTHSTKPAASRRTIWFATACVIAVLVIIGAVLGGVLSKVLSKKTGDASSSQGEAHTLTATTTIHGSAHATTTITSPTSAHSASSTQSASSSSSSIPTTQGPGGVTIECPDVDNTTYTVPGTSQVYKLYCGANYAGGDIQNAPKNSMQECLALCAKYNANKDTTKQGCVGVTWVYVGPQGTGVNYCWVKSALGRISYLDNMESAALL